MERRIIDEQLDQLRDKILLLGGATEAAVQKAMRALVERDSELARKVLEDDKIIDQMELEIDRLSIEILALQHPAAHDLRFVISVAKSHRFWSELPTMPVALPKLPWCSIPSHQSRITWTFRLWRRRLRRCCGRRLTLSQMKIQSFRVRSSNAIRKSTVATSAFSTNCSK